MGKQAQTSNSINDFNTGNLGKLGKNMYISKKLHMDFKKSSK